MNLFEVSYGGGSNSFMDKRHFVIASDVVDAIDKVTRYLKHEKQCEGILDGDGSLRKEQNEFKITNVKLVTETLIT